MDESICRLTGVLFIVFASFANYGNTFMQYYGSFYEIVCILKPPRQTVVDPDQNAASDHGLQYFLTRIAIKNTIKMKKLQTPLKLDMNLL